MAVERKPHNGEKFDAALTSQKTEKAFTHCPCIIYDEARCIATTFPQRPGVSYLGAPQLED